MLVSRLAATVGLMVLVAGCASAPRAESEHESPDHWRTLAATDIRAARQTLLDAHPGAIDTSDPKFLEWLDVGSEQALAYVPRVRTYDDMLAVVRFYIAGFHDGHLVYSDNLRTWSDIVIDGWHVIARGDSVVVDAVAPGWPVPLPPVGSEFLGCDSRDGRQVLAQDVTPFTHATIGPGGRNELLANLTTGPLSDRRWHSCRFAAADGHMMDIPQSWNAVPWDTFVQLMSGSWPQSKTRVDSIEVLPDRTLWIHAGDFQPSNAQNIALEKMIEALRQGPTPSRIVFDARGNSGGDSAIGDRIFAAATGGIDMDSADPARFPVTSAWWRVSDVAIASLARRDALLVERGSDARTVAAVRQVRADMIAARARGEAWVHQAGSDTPRLGRADMQALHAHLRRPIGTIALLTDDRCASACLDFADLVRSVPGSIHVGSETSADSVYIDVGNTMLPSGNWLMLPLKVWRDRLRGNNETLIPDVSLSFDAKDEQANRRAVLEALDPHTAPSRTIPLR